MEQRLEYIFWHIPGQAKPTGGPVHGPCKAFRCCARVVQEQHRMAILWPQFPPHGRQGSCAVGVCARSFLLKRSYCVPPLPQQVNALATITSHMGHASVFTALATVGSKMTVNGAIHAWIVWGPMLPYLAASATESIPVPFVANHHQGQQEQTKTNQAEMKQTTPTTTTKVSSPNCHKLPTLINHRNLKEWLQGYDTAEQSFLINGFLNGVDIGFQQSVSNISVPNHSSANYHPGIVNDYITAELSANRIEGPHTKIPFPTFQTSPLGVVPKKTHGDFRIIHDLSVPESLSINQGIPRTATHVQYASIEDAVRLVKASDVGSFMAKTDIKKAYRIIPIKPQQYHLFCFEWKNSFYFDKCLQMGCSSSSQIFEKFSSAVEWVAKHHKKIPHICHILDDFFLVDPSQSGCQNKLDIFLQTCAHINIPMAPDKTTEPNTTMCFMGYEIDSVKSEIRLPSDKLEKCKYLIQEFLRVNKITLVKLQSLIGLLNFTCAVIIPGRAFLRCIIDLTLRVSKPFHHIRVTQEVKKDLHIWLHFLLSYNGTTLFREEMFLEPTSKHLVTDAAGGKGFGAFLDNHWFYGEWPAWWKHQNIVLLELVPIVLAVETWGCEFQNAAVTCHTDNEALVAIINKQSSKLRVVMTMIRRLVQASLKYNFLFKAVFVPGLRNQKADALSRFQVQLFRRLHPTANRQPSAFLSLPESLS